MSAPDARESLGEINYMQVAMGGDCAEIGNSRPLMICLSTPSISSVAQIIGGNASPCVFVLTSALADAAGNPPAPGISN